MDKIESNRYLTIAFRKNKLIKALREVEAIGAKEYKHESYTVLIRNLIRDRDRYDFYTWLNECYETLMKGKEFFSYPNFLDGALDKFRRAIENPAEVEPKIYVDKEAVGEAATNEILGDLLKDKPNATLSDKMKCIRHWLTAELGKHDPLKSSREDLKSWIFYLELDQSLSKRGSPEYEAMDVAIEALQHLISFEVEAQNSDDYKVPVQAAGEDYEEPASIKKSVPSVIEGAQNTEDLRSIQEQSNLLSSSASQQEPQLEPATWSNAESDSESLHTSV